MISNEYRELMVETHKDEKWGKSAGFYIGYLQDFISSSNILDYGSGKCALKEHYPDIKCYDPAFDDELPECADIVLCIDVLEHVEPKYLDDVINHVASLSKQKAFFAISTREAKKILPDGRNAHLIIQDSDWWHKKLSSHFDKLELIRKNSYSVYYGYKNVE